MGGSELGGLAQSVVALETEGFTMVGKHNVWPIWRYESPDIARGSILTFALTDNLFIACLSSNVGDIVPLLEAYDNRIRSANDITPR